MLYLINENKLVRLWSISKCLQESNVRLLGSGGVINGIQNLT